MEEKDIRMYAKLMQEMDLTALEVDENGAHVRMERMPAQAAGAARPVAVSVAAPSAEAVAVSTATVQAAAPVSDGTEEIRSPMVGVFYAAPSENAEPFVQVGDTIHKGDVLCIIEAMKLMNEITAEQDGVITEICVGNNQIVDFGHVLFRIRKEQA